jgi:hypothetical protein
MTRTGTEAFRVVVGVTDGPDDVVLLRRAAAEARRLHAVLVPVLAWSADGRPRCWTSW